MYFGEAITKLDEKGRITVPRRVRETMDVLGHAIWYMTRGFDQSIFLFHRDEWQRIMDRVSQFASMDETALDFRRLFFSSLAEARPDGQGRFAIPPHLRKHSGLEGEDREAVLIGVGDHLELWNKDTWEQFLENKEPVYKQIAAPMFTRKDNGQGATEKGGQDNAD